MSEISFLAGQKHVYVKGDRDIMIQEIMSKVDRQQQKIEILEIISKDRINQLEKEVKELKQILGYLLILLLKIGLISFKTHSDI